jgi:hypothetical protein
MNPVALRKIYWATTAWILLAPFGANETASAQTPSAKIDAALQNITNLVRPGRIGYATVWDGNKYIQCRRTVERAMRCEAAGSILQPSLNSVLTIGPLSQLAALGWTIDPNFGNYVHTFPAEMPTARVADHILQTLIRAYDADVSGLEFQTRWVANVPCPPRNGPGQNLAGIVNDAQSMRATALLTCSYTAESSPRRAASAHELIDIYGTRATAEIQRLRVNAARHVYTVFNAGIGYVQCMPNASPPELYCEAQSPESWPALASVLTPERVSILHTAGYNDPGRAPNYSKTYPLDKFSDAAIAEETLSILYGAYGYTGAMKLKITTER